MDVNDKGPRFQGADVNGNYPAAVSGYTSRGDEVIYVSAIDEDATEANNRVSKLVQVILITSPSSVDNNYDD